MKAATGHESTISAASARALLSPQPGLSAKDGAMGLGVFLQGEGTARYFFHGGANEGYCAYMIGFPETGQGAVVMTNADSGADLIIEIRRVIAEEYDWPERFSVTEKKS